jgi:LUD domain
MDWAELASDDAVERTADALRKHGIEVIIVESGSDARKKALELIPKKAEVFNATSITLEKIGVAKEIEESGEYDSVRNRIKKMSNGDTREKARKGSLSPDYVIGSVHAVTEDGKVAIASATGSQLPQYAYGANHVIWVVGTQKIVRSLDDALRRIHEYSLPLESERLRKRYNFPGSSVNKILIFERERPGRIRLIFVKENLGF